MFLKNYELNLEQKNRNSRKLYMNDGSSLKLDGHESPMGAQQDFI